MDFEFDPNKSAANKAKHGIDFKDAQKLWADPSRLELEAKQVGEIRRLLLGKIGPKHWAAIFTYRGTVIRIISVRRARENEEEIYKDNC